MSLTISGVISDKEGKPIDKTHAEWVVRQFLTLLKWCGLHFDGSVADAKRVDIYRTGVVDVPALDTEKPVRVRHKYARQGGEVVKPQLRVVKSEAETESAPTSKCTPGTVCHFGGRVTKVCVKCLEHCDKGTVGTDGICQQCNRTQGETLT